MSNTQIELRAAADEDIDALCALFNRSLRHDGVPQVRDPQEFREDLFADTFVLDDDLRMIVDADGRPIAFASILHMPSDVRLERAFIEGTVHPDHRGRGLGRALLGWAIERARTKLLASTNDLPKHIRVEEYDYIDDAHRLYRHMGFTEVRFFEELLMPLGKAVPAPAAKGYAIVPLDPSLDDAVLDVHNRSFADHWGSTPWSAERCQDALYGFSGRADLSVAAVHLASGTVVGICLADHFPQDEAILGRRDGWIGTLGTLAEHRGRGLGSAMITASIARFVAAGFTHAAIGVDGDSLTGAARLYRSLGFELRQRALTHEITL